MSENGTSSSSFQSFHCSGCRQVNASQFVHDQGDEEDGQDEPRIDHCYHHYDASCVQGGLFGYMRS